MGFDHLKPVILLRFAGLLSPKPCFWFKLNVNVINFILNDTFVSRYFVVWMRYKEKDHGCTQHICFAAGVMYFGVILLSVHVVFFYIKKKKSFQYGNTKSV